MNAAASVQRVWFDVALAGRSRALSAQSPVPGPRHQDEPVAMLTRRNEALRELGCSLYDVGVHAGAPDTVFVVEVWQSEEAHRHCLESAQVQAAIAAARPVLSGEFGGFRFDIVGSPLRTA